MALSLFAGVIILFLQTFAVTEAIIPNMYLRRIANLIFSVARLYVPVLIFMRLQSSAGAAPVNPPKAEDLSVKNKITLAFAAFAFIFSFGMLYSVAFPSAASSFDDNNIFSAILTVIASAVVPAVFEELLYRKLLCTELTLHGGVFATIISALLFGLAHFSFYTFPYAFVCGLVLAFVYLKTGSVKYSIAVHFANNFLGYVCAYISTKMNPLDYGNVIMLVIIALGVMALGACYTIFPNMKNASLTGIASAPSSVFLTFPMMVYIICAVLMNFI
jgi:membrane protease YdiL (CAAX protease family)